MTNQEAIQWIDGRILELSTLYDINRSDAGAKRINEEYKALKLARDAIRKQIPETVTHQATLKKCCTCPSCLNVVDEFVEVTPWQKIRVEAHRCRFCGQALKWKDTENSAIDSPSEKP